MTEKYIEFVNSKKYVKILSMSEDDVIECEMNFIDKLFPLVEDKNTQSDTYNIFLSSLHNSLEFESIKDKLLKSLEFVLGILKITENGIDVEYLKLIKNKDIINILCRIIKTLMYHKLYINAHLLTFRLEKFKVHLLEKAVTYTPWVKALMESTIYMSKYDEEFKEPCLYKKY